jgi:hypothetical protein
MVTLMRTSSVPAFDHSTAALTQVFGIKREIRSQPGEALQREKNVRLALFHKEGLYILSVVWCTVVIRLLKD